LVEETTIAQGLHVTDENAKYDASCKRLLSEKAILGWILKEAVEEFKDCSVKEIAAKYIEGQPQVSVVPVLPDEPCEPDEDTPIIHGMDTEDKSIHEGTVTFDIYFRAILPGTGETVVIIINIEVQNDFYPGYPLIMRGIYYCCRMISSQYGREFTNSHYEKIKKVYSIWVCLNPPDYRKNTITRYHIAEKNVVGKVAETVKNYDLLSVIMICLGGPDDDNYNGILRMLDVLLSDENSETEKRKILQEDYDIQMTQTISKEMSDMCNLSKGVMEKGIAKGLAEGLVKGHAEGLAEGILSSIKRIVKNMGVSVEQAMSVLEVPEAERQKYMELLEKQ